MLNISLFVKRDKKQSESRSSYLKSINLFYMFKVQIIFSD